MLEESGYWINLAEPDFGTIHRASCTYTEGRETDENWWGIYATLGAAVDAVLGSYPGRKAWEGRCCIAPRLSS